jgi:hypothetical protein
MVRASGHPVMSHIVPHNIESVLAGSISKPGVNLIRFFGSIFIASGHDSPASLYCNVAIKQHVYYIIRNNLCVVFILYELALSDGLFVFVVLHILCMLACAHVFHT